MDIRSKAIKENIDLERELDISFDNEDTIYPMNNLKVEKGFYTVFELKRKFDSNNKRIILDSNFQRDDVWGNEKKSELIESVLMGLPLPIFYFNQDKYGRLIVVDGRQRLTALFDFLDDKLILRKLKILRELNDKKFSQLSPVLAGRIEDYQIQAHVIMPPTPDRIKFDIFDRVNRGGMQLNKQEIRNALYQGYATELLKQITCGERFRLATGDAFKKERRMKDKYLITRFLSLYLYDKGVLQDDDGCRYAYKGDRDELFGKGLEYVNKMQQIAIKKLKNVIEDGLYKSYYYLGKDAFRTINNGVRSPINMNIFEAVMFIMNEITDEIPKIIVEKRVHEFIASDLFIDNIGNHRDSKNKLEWRIENSKKVGKSLKEKYDK